MEVTAKVPATSVGKLLRSIRLQQNPSMTIGEASKKAGCPNINNYTNIENGKRSITPEKLLEYVTNLLDGDRNEAVSRIMLWSMHLNDGEGPTVVRD